MDPVAQDEKTEIDEIKARYQPLIAESEKTEVYKPKMVGLNPGLRPPVTKSRANLFPMAGLWSQKKLLQTTNMTRGVKNDEQIEACKQQGKRHNKKMYAEKEYLEEYLKFKDVIGSSKQ